MLASLIVLFSGFASAHYNLAHNSSLIGALKSDENFNYDNYYQIKEDQNMNQFDLLVFKHHFTKFPLPNLPYDRDFHFGGWLRDTTDGKCLNTRGKVLVRDAVSSVTYTPDACTVVSGEWDDPYTARMHTFAKDIQIDHVVALKNAYMTGAHEWDFKKRCLYSNYQGNNFHLLAVNGKENLRKSDFSPSGYVPPNKVYTCEFIKGWLHIKLIWSLRVTPKEATAINRIAAQSNCDPQSFIVSSAELKAQRDFMSENANMCDSATVMIEKF